jgi:hypothetical protein
VILTLALIHSHSQHWTSLILPTRGILELKTKSNMRLVVVKLTDVPHFRGCDSVKNLVWDFKQGVDQLSLAGGH